MKIFSLNGSSAKKAFVKFLGPFLFLLLEVIGKPETMSQEAFHVLCIAVWMAAWWVTEAVPIAVTALLPIVLFPLTGALPIGDTTASFGHKYIFLYMGGFMLAIAIERWNLHRRIALNIIALIGTKLTRIILGFMVASAFLSMWISNTATSVMMLPIGMAIIDQFPTDKPEYSSKFGKALMLGIAYSCSIGGIATLIGTPPNLVLAGILEKLFHFKLGFFEWAKFGFPISVLLLVICWKYLTRYAFDFRGVSFPGGREEIVRMKHKLGKISYEEKAVLAVFSITALAWILRSPVQKVIPGLDDTVIAMVAGVSLFLIPAKNEKRSLLTWKEAVKLPWGIILLFGGGMALAEGFSQTELANWIAGHLTQFHNLPFWLLLLILVTAVNFLTEVTSNMATTAMLLPILAPMALSLDLHPFVMMIAVTMAASCAFMLPVATPPNAIVFGSGHLRIPDMIKTGVSLNILSIIIITLATYFLLPVIWEIHADSFPEELRRALDIAP
ncbi:SLC13 family permease [Sinomicrobium soli]|uniref:SLC13 family permease n=1 Tax=Sinomicrobium sp. N-1-3-6 TaxID=2219864 RepID=UPI000DCAF66F|nr:SLC13 family permease [Sinomicrobium sp. N-1-3-6]RAV29135.1 anion transporter [Sinomicrobium sp. N-1-3-6]